MFVFLESLRSALASIRAHRMRSFLTSLGIIIGVAAVITVISLIQGLSSQISQQFAGLGANTLTVRPHTAFKDAMQGNYKELKLQDIDFLKSRIEAIQSLNPSLGLGMPQIRFGTNETSARLVAATTNFQEIAQRFVDKGRFLTQSDEDTARRVVVLGSKTVQSLRLPHDPIGQYVSFNNEWFKVVGVLEKKGEFFGMSQDEIAIIPFRTGRSLSGNELELYSMQFSVSLKDNADIEETKNKMKRVLRQSHKLEGDTEDDFEVQASDSISKSFSSTIASITLVMGGVVGISLLVGGIGIMNIMLVSVTERTREIGICKAIGARKRDIMMQFLIEAVTLSVLGGVIGLMLGYFLGFAIAKMIPDFPDAVVPWWAVALAFFFSAGVGIIFGVAPANKAANLDPIEALRYE